MGCIQSIVVKEGRRMNNGNEVARQIIEWLKIEGVAYRLK
jgi:hypothetical protein